MHAYVYVCIPVSAIDVHMYVCMGTLSLNIIKGEMKQTTVDPPAQTEETTIALYSNRPTADQCLENQHRNSKSTENNAV